MRERRVDRCGLVPVLTSMIAFGASNLWWPDDRAWCVASEIDLEFTYVGGSRALIDDLLKLAELEVQPSTLTDGEDAEPPN